MSKRLTVACIIPLVLSACTPVLNQTSPAGELRAGIVSPCHGGYVMNDQVCGQAIHNARVINSVQIGQLKEEVRAIMGHDPERREATTERETWSYLTDYDRELMTAIVFVDGRVAEIKTTAWREEAEE